MKYFLELPHTPEALALDINWTEINTVLQIVYKKTPNSNNYVFAGEYFPDNDGIKQEENAIIVPVSSVYAGTDHWYAGDEFVNLLKSSGDKAYETKMGRKVQTTWHDLAKAANISWNCHAEADKFYDCETELPVSKIDDKEYVCDTNFVGGHVKKGRIPTTMSDYSTVYILPICHNHNSKGINHSNRTPGNGNGFFMRVAQNTNVLKMIDYLPHNSIQHLLINAKPIE